MAAPTNEETAPFVIVATVQITAGRVEEFLPIIKADAEGSRNEAGCMRFDVLQDSSDPNKFVFYEVYKDVAAFESHQAEPHYQPWNEFYKNGGVEKLDGLKMNGLYFTSN